MSEADTKDILKRFPVGSVMRVTFTVTSHDASDSKAPFRLTYGRGAEDYFWPRADDDFGPQEIADNAEIITRPIQAGDHVRHDMAGRAIVVHTHGSVAWICTDGGNDQIVPLSDLEAA